jgi:hypothetical protein
MYFRSCKDRLIARVTRQSNLQGGVVAMHTYLSSDDR